MFSYCRLNFQVARSSGRHFNMGSDINLDCGLRDHVITRFASEVNNKIHTASIDQYCDAFSKFELTVGQLV